MTKATLQNNAAILWSSFGPYHVVRIEAAADALSRAGCKLTAFRFTEKSDTYGWVPVQPRQVEVVTLSDSQPQGILPSIATAWKFLKEIRTRKIQSVFLPSFSPLPNTLCLVAAWASRRHIILMTESWDATGKSGAFSRLIKRTLTALCDAALVGGTPQKSYLAGLGMPEERIFTGYDVVDVEHFAKASDRLLEDGTTISPARESLLPWLPEMYFLSLGRFVEKKNLDLLVEAYGMAKRELPSLSIKLVMVGSGPGEAALKAGVKAAGLVGMDVPGDDPADKEADVFFYPFQQIEKTPQFFTFAEAFILPSLWEEWGLVVNEAMACRAPVLVSSKVGAGFDLIEEGVNGFVFDPRDTRQLKDLLLRFHADPSLRDRMGKAGRETVQKWGPELFGQSAAAAWQTANNP